MGTLSVDNLEKRSTGETQDVLDGQNRASGYCNDSSTLFNAFNVSSITDDAVGQQSFNFTASFTTLCTPVAGTADGNGNVSVGGNWTSIVQVRNFDFTNAYADTFLTLHASGDLA